MRIAVNTQLLIDGKLEGLGWFTYEVLNRIVKAHPEHTFIFIFSRPYSDKFVFASNVEPVIVGPKYGHPLVWFLKFTFIMPRMLKKLRADLYLSPDGWCPRATSIKQVAVIHDLNFVHHPEWLSFWYRNYYRIFFKRWAKNAARLATVSEFSKQDLVSSYKIDQQKIDVVYNGANTHFSPLNQQQKQQTREQFTGGLPYFVFVGATPPRKNIVNLFKAFDIYKQTTGSSHKLVMAGAKHWWANYIRETYEAMEYKHEVVFTNRVSTEDLNRLISSSEALVYVSLFEGFGIPLVEAMHCETAIITSNCTSMPEVAGNAALLVDPHNPHDIASAMHRIVTDTALREQLIVNGRERRSFFSWDKSAEKLWQCIAKCI